MSWAKITYRDFYDVPRMFLVRRRRELLLFDSEFDQKADDFLPAYSIYLLPELSSEELAGDWTALRTKATRFLGKIAVQSVQFDSSLREKVNLDVLEHLER